MKLRNPWKKEERVGIKRFYSTREAVSYVKEQTGLVVSRLKIYSAIKDGRLKAINTNETGVKAVWKIRREWLDEYIEKKVTPRNVKPDDDDDGIDLSL